MSEAAMLPFLDIVMLGNANTGKQSLYNSLADIPAADPPSSSRARSNRITMMKRKYCLTKEDKTFGIRYWLSRGDFRTSSSFIKTIGNLQAVIVLVNLSDKKSLHKIDCYFQGFTRSKVPLFLVGNMSDLDREITEKEMMSIAEKYNAQYFQVSTLTGHNLNEFKQSLFLSALKECENKGGSSEYLQSMRKSQHSLKRAALSRLALQVSCGKRYRSEMLNAVVMKTMVPQQMQDSAIEIEYEKQNEIEHLGQSQLIAQGDSAIAVRKQSLEEPAMNVIKSQNWLDSIQLLKSSNSSLMSSLLSSVMQHIQFEPLKIEVIQ